MCQLFRNTWSAVWCYTLKKLCGRRRNISDGLPDLSWQCFSSESHFGACVICIILLQQVSLECSAGLMSAPGVYQIQLVGHHPSLADVSMR